MKEKTTTQEQRRRLVARAMTVMGLTMPAVLDSEDAKVEKAFAAWPLRIVVVDPSAQIELDVRFQLSGRAAVDYLGDWLAKRFGGVVL